MISTVIEVLQLLVGLAGFVGAVAEIREEVHINWHIKSRDRRRQIISDHIVLIELFRLGAHLAVIVTASMGLSLPPAPSTMGLWYTSVIMAQKMTILFMACVAASATWTTRRMRQTLWSLP